MYQKILKIGITGGIGSGKTTVCSIFETLGIPIYYADDRAKRLMTEDTTLVAAIQNVFGTDAYDSNGSLNRAYIAQIVFNEPAKLQSLNALVHPAVRRDAQNWHESQLNTPYTLQEAALLFENNSYKLFDKIIVVSAPQELRLQRVLQRDKMDSKAVLARMAQQLPETDKVKKADFVIYNDGKTLLVPQVMAIHQKLSWD
jgi:dephospho-CoA kinase